jgi:hypothetical protein
VGVVLIHRETCRLCDSKDVKLVVKLKPIPPQEKYLESLALAKEIDVYPVDLYMCQECGHVQQLDVLDSETLWEGYTYFSGKAKGMVKHFNQFSSKVIDNYKPKSNSLVIDIGSNDGSLLRPFKSNGYEVLGIDPAKEIAKEATATGIETIPDVLTFQLAQEIKETRGSASIITAFNAYAHADNMREMTQGIQHMLSPDGLFFFEVQYLLDVIDKMLIGTIFHEHMSHHSVKPMKLFLEEFGLELIDIERVPIQHGSLIGTVQLKGGKHSINQSVKKIIELEDKLNLDKLETLISFNEKLMSLRNETAKLVRQWKNSNATVAGYGAARSGQTLISQYGFEGIIEFIVDDHPQKVYKYPAGDGIQVIPTDELYKRMPDFTIILAWVHSEKIIKDNQKYLDNGGHFVVLSPELKVI